MELKLGHLADNTGKVVVMQKKLSMKKAEFASTMLVLKESGATCRRRIGSAVS